MYYRVCEDFLQINIKDKHQEKKLNTYFTEEDTGRTKITENGIQCFQSSMKHKAKPQEIPHQTHKNGFKKLTIPNVGMWSNQNSHPSLMRV